MWFCVSREFLTSVFLNARALLLACTKAQHDSGSASCAAVRDLPEYGRGSARH